MTPRQRAAALAATRITDLTLASEAHVAVGHVASALLESGIADNARAFDLAWDAVMGPFRAWERDRDLARQVNRALAKA